jgi:hypothetical protein
MQPLKDALQRSDDVLFVFYDFETTQEARYSDLATRHVPNLVCVQQFCSRCEMQQQSDVECPSCGKRKHAFYDDPVGDLLSYVCEARPWAARVVAIAHNASGFDLQFILNRTVLLRWRPELIMNGLKIVSMRVHHIQFLDSVLYLPMPLNKMPEAFGLSVEKSWYPHYFNREENLNYVGSIPDVEYFRADAMGASERRDFFEWFECQRGVVFDNRRVLEEYCQQDVTVLRQECQTFRRDFMEIGNVDVFLDSLTIASACNRVFRKKFLKPDTIGLIPTGGYSLNRKYRKKALMWLMYMERADGSAIQHCRNGREYRLPELPAYSVDGYCAESKTVFEFLGCLWHGHICQPFRDVIATSGDTLTDRYEQTMARI